MIWRGTFPCLLRDMPRQSEQFEGQYIHHHFVIWEESMPIDRVGYHLAAAMCSLLMFLIVAVVVMFYDVDVDVDGYYSFSMLMRRCW